MPPCPHCQRPMFTKSGGGTKLKLSRAVLVMHVNGDIETNCPGCRRGVIIGSHEQMALRKARPALVVRTMPR